MENEVLRVTNDDEAIRLAEKGSGPMAGEDIHIWQRREFDEEIEKGARHVMKQPGPWRE